jgi:hypothetical protein
MILTGHPYSLHEFFKVVPRQMLTQALLRKAFWLRELIGISSQIPLILFFVTGRKMCVKTVTNNANTILRIGIGCVASAIELIFFLIFLFRHSVVDVESVAIEFVCNSGICLSWRSCWNGFHIREKDSNQS